MILALILFLMARDIDSRHGLPWFYAFIFAFIYSIVAFFRIGTQYSNFGPVFGNSLIATLIAFFAAWLYFEVVKRTGQNYWIMIIGALGVVFAT